jgi:hypothetical protein
MMRRESPASAWATTTGEDGCATQDSSRSLRALPCLLAPAWEGGQPTLGYYNGREQAPEADVLTLCGDNLVYRADMAEGICRGLLCAFHYYGVPDEVDYANIPWRSRRFDEEALTVAVATTHPAEA